MGGCVRGEEAGAQGVGDASEENQVGPKEV